MDWHESARTAVTVLLSTPFLSLLALGVPTILARPVWERAVSRLVAWAMVVEFGASLWALVAYLNHSGSIALDFGHWFAWGNYHLPLRLYLDELSVTCLFAWTAIAVLVAHFAVRYLHREPGYLRFFIVYFLFLIGFQLVTLAGTMDILFAGWELVGLSSVFLIGFYQCRAIPVKNSLYALAHYRLSDGFLLAFAFLWHHTIQDSILPMDFQYQGAELLPGHSHWMLLGVLALIAALPKSAQFPFGTWLSRALEGPTPSSAVFYGAVSIHLGVYLILRIYPVFNGNLILRAMLILGGSLTCLFAVWQGRVRSDAKGILAMASVAQVSLMFIEMGLGFPELAGYHLIAHAWLRTFQLLRSPSAIQDFQVRKLGEWDPTESISWERGIPARLRHRLYFWALNEFGVEELIRGILVKNWRKFGTVVEAAEDAWLRCFDRRLG